MVPANDEDDNDDECTQAQTHCRDAMVVDVCNFVSLEFYC